jgi:hypothetical protein
VSRGERGGSPTVVNLSFLDRGKKITPVPVIKLRFVRFEDFSVTTMKTAVFWDVSVLRLPVNANVIRFEVFTAVTMTKAVYSSSGMLCRVALVIADVRGTPVLTKATRRNIPQDGIHKC